MTYTRLAFSALKAREYIPENVQIQNDISSIEDAITRKDYKSIIDDPEKFWLAYCIIFSQNKTDQSEHFSMNLNKKSIIISAKNHNIKATKNCIEEIRTIFFQRRQKCKDFTFFLIDDCTESYIIKECDVLDLKHCMKRQKSHGNHVLEQWIIPCMEKLSESLGANCIKAYTPNIHSKFSYQPKEILSFKIEWNRENQFVYRIPPKSVPKRESPLETWHTMYQNQFLCDLTLIAENVEIKLHSLLLYTYGGEIFQKMLTNGFKESVDKVISLKEFSLNTVRAFIDFIYLGENALQPEVTCTNAYEVSELLRLAHTYQIPSLVDHCANLLCLVTSAEDAEAIKLLADKCEIEQLKKLYEHLLLDGNSKKIKV